MEATRLNKTSLKFNDNKLEKEFRAQYFRNSIFIYRLAIATTLLMYAAFGFFDTHTSSAYSKEFLIIRFAIVIPILVVTLLLSLHKRFQQIWQTFTFGVLIISGSGIIYMLHRNPDNLYYYGGIFLIFIGGYFYTKLRFLAASIAGTLLIVIYNLSFPIFQSVFDTQFDQLITANAFFIAANIICMIGLYNSERLERSDFHQKQTLSKQKTEIANYSESLEEEVRRRTKQIDLRTESLLSEIKNRKHTEQKLMDALMKAEESDRLKSEFLASMNHEIRTPLNAICGFSTIIAETVEDPELIEFSKVVLKQNNLLLKLINDLIDFAKLESGSLDLVLEDFDINDILDELYIQFAPECHADLRLEKYKAKEAVIIHSDRLRVKQIFANLLSNALKFTTKGVVEFGIKTNAYGEQMCFVKDTGIGISKENLELIMERFSKIDNFSQGSGLGLSIVDKLLPLVSSKLVIESNQGVGSNFYFGIPGKPLTETPLPASIKLNESVKKDMEGAQKSITILIAEDDPINYIYIKKLLSLRNYKLLHAPDGMEAIAMVQKNTPIDLILMDLKMPKVDGFEATRRIKLLNPNIPIIAQTAFSYQKDRKKALDAGCNGFITKPLEKAQLYAIIEKALDSTLN